MQNLAHKPWLNVQLDNGRILLSIIGPGPPDRTMIVTDPHASLTLPLTLREAVAIGHGLRGGVGVCDYCGQTVRDGTPLYVRPDCLMCANCHIADREADRGVGT